MESVCTRCKIDQAYNLNLFGRKLSTMGSAMASSHGLEAMKAAILDRLDTVPTSLRHWDPNSCASSAAMVLYCLTGQQHHVSDYLREGLSIHEDLTEKHIRFLSGSPGNSVLLFDIGEHKFCVLLSNTDGRPLFEIIQSNQNDYAVHPKTKLSGPTFTLRDWLLQSPAIDNVPNTGIMELDEFVAFCRDVAVADDPLTCHALFGVAFRCRASQGRFINIQV